MDIGSILLILAVFVIAAAFVARPLIRAEAVMVSEEDQNLSSLMAERERILNALAELDFDHEMGKVPEEAYPKQREELALAGIEILRQIDAFQANGSHEAGIDPLESAIAEHKQEAVRVSEADDPMEAMIAARRDRQEAQSSGKFCSQCGQSITAGDKFCSHCGNVLT